MNPRELQYRNAQAGRIARAWVQIPDDFPLELVANIASRLLNGEDYAQAVDRALGLLQKCVQQLTTNKETKELIRMELEWTVKSPDLEFPEGLFKIPYGEAIKRITRQNRPDRAEEDYRSFLEASNSSQRKAERTAALKREEREGIDAALVQERSAQFETLRYEGNLGKRKRPKKSL